MCRWGMLVVLVAVLGGLAGCGQPASMGLTPAAVPIGAAVATMPTSTQPATGSPSATSTPRLSAADMCWQAIPPYSPPEKRAMEEDICRLSATALAQPRTPVTVAPPPTRTATATTIPATLTAITALPTCRAADLAIYEGGTNAGGGMIYLILYFRNQGSVQCALAGVPGLELLSENGTVILSTPASADLTGRKTWGGEPAGRVALLPDLAIPIPHRENGPGYAVAYLTYSTRGPGAGRCEPLVPVPRQMRLTLPESGEALLLDWSIGTCDGRIGTLPFQATGRTSP